MLVAPPRVPTHFSPRPLLLAALALASSSLPPQALVLPTQQVLVLSVTLLYAQCFTFRPQLCFGQLRYHVLFCRPCCWRAGHAMLNVAGYATASRLPR